MNKWFKVIGVFFFIVVTSYISITYSNYKQVKEDLHVKKQELQLLDLRQKSAKQILTDLEINKDKLLSSQFTISSYHPVYKNAMVLISAHGLQSTSIHFTENPFTLQTEMKLSGSKESWKSFLQSIENESKAVFVKSLHLSREGEMLSGTIELEWFVDFEGKHLQPE